MILNVLEYPTAASVRVYPRWWRIVDGVADVVRVGVDERGRPYTGPAYDPVAVVDDGRWRGPCLALPQYTDMMSDPWRPGAHDEERLAVGGERCFWATDRRPHGHPPPPGRAYAPGGAGLWLAVGMVPVTDYTGDCPVTNTTTVWACWTVPTDAARGAS